MGQESGWAFFGSVIAAYLAACGGWALAFKLRPAWWPYRQAVGTRQRWLDLAMVFVVAAAVLGLGQAWRAGWLLPQPMGWVGDLVWQLNNLIIYAPVFVALACRRQSAETIYLSPRGLPVKLATGLLLGALAVAIFHVLRDRPQDPRAIVRTLVEAASWRSLENFLPVFLEGAVLAFAFVRLCWALGPWPALLVPAVLFAAAHIPQQIDSGLAPAMMAAYFAATAVITVAVLATLGRSRDIVWLGIVHYLMDVAIGSFSASPL